MPRQALIAAEVVRAWQRGEEDAVRAVFAQCYPPAVRFGVLSGLGPDRAQDCAQDAFIRAYERREQLRDPAAFAVWFHRIVTRCLLDLLAGPNEALAGLPDDEELAEDWARNQVPRPEEVALTNERREGIWRQIERLPPGYRVPLVLRYYHGFSTREVAEIVGVSHGAARVTLHRAMRRLRVALVEERAPRERT